jgi:hypothetical protein
MAQDKRKSKSADDMRSEIQAKAQFDSIAAMVKALNAADEGDDEDARDATRTAITEDPLSVQVRSGWYTPGDSAEPEEYMILQCTGGPAVRIIGELGEYNEPSTASIQHQDWGTPWADYRLTREQEEIVLTYVRCFYFGE